MSDPASPDDPLDNETREKLIALIMKRDGVGREEAEKALDRAEAETLRMRDA